MQAMPFLCVRVLVFCVFVPPPFQHTTLYCVCIFKVYMLNRNSGWLVGLFLEFYNLATSKVISVWVLICDSTPSW